MKAEAHTKEHIATITKMVRAQRALVQDYLDGHLDVRAEEQAREERQELLRVPPDNRPNSRFRGKQRSLNLNREQKRYLTRLNAAVDLALVVQNATDEDEADEESPLPRWLQSVEQQTVSSCTERRAPRDWRRGPRRGDGGAAGAQRAAHTCTTWCASRTSATATSCRS